MAHINSGIGGLIFLDAPGGTGKTPRKPHSRKSFFFSSGHVPLAATGSRIAAQVLQGGQTAHSTFKIPLKLTGTEIPMCAKKRGSALASLLQKCKVIFWDEATMSHRLAVEALV